MSKDLQDLLPQLGLVPCVLIGHSMGGRTGHAAGTSEGELSLSRASSYLLSTLRAQQAAWNSSEPWMAEIPDPGTCPKVPSLLSCSRSWWSA